MAVVMGTDATKVARPTVTVVAHLPRYAWTARALWEADLLDRFVSLPLVTRRASTRRAVPGLVLEPELRRAPHRTLWATAVTEAVGRVVPPVRARRDRVLTAEARRLVGAPGVAHLVHGLGTPVIEAVHRRDGLVVVDVRALHPVARQGDLRRLLERRGIQPVLPIAGRVPALLEEIDRADVLVANSELTRASYLQAGVEPARIVVVHPGVVAPDVRYLRPPDPDHPRVLFVGRAIEAKGLHDLADAAHALPHAAMVRVVGPPAAEVQPVFGAVEATVEATGPLPRRNLVHQYHWADVLVHPSLSDGFGLSVLEAMAHGRPAIVSDRSGVAELLTDGVDGWVVPAGDPDALRARLLEVLEDADALAAAGEAAARTAAHHGFDRYAADLLRAYRETILPLLDMG